MSLVEQAYQSIKDRILRNEYGPRYQALEQEIATDLGMSRTPVREALIRLQNEGLVQCIPRRGMRVVPLSAKDMKEIYQVLTSLETMAVDLLARSQPKPEDIAPLQKALDDMDQALESEDLAAWATADENFHKALLDLCGNRRLADMANTVMDQVYRARWVTLRLRPTPWQSNAEHRGVVEAILKGDWEAARAIHYDHRREASEVITQFLDQEHVPEL
jgi:DNA-binding GntR family transcriptional regulator